MNEPGAEGRAWHLDELVSALRAKSVALEHGRIHGSVARVLPSRALLIEIVAKLRAALFPWHFGVQDLTHEGVDYFVGHTLDAALCALREEVRRGLHFGDGGAVDAQRSAKATEVTREFAAGLPAVRELLDSDIRAAFEGDAAAKSLDEALFCYPGVTAITYHRLARGLHVLGVPLIPRMIAELAHGTTGIDIHPGAEIGGSFFIDHGTGVVIGETCLIGERVRLYQGVTLGARSFPVDDRGHPVKGTTRHPVVEDDVIIYAGATILGRVTIGRGSTVGGNVWLTRSVPPDSHITQAQP